MEPEIQPLLPEAPPPEAATETTVPLEPVATGLKSRILRGLSWTFLGDEGLRAGWSVLIFAFLFSIFASAVGFVFVQFHLIDKKDDFTASAAFFGELIGFLALLGAAAVVAFIEQRRSLLAFNLTGPRRIPHFLSGLAAGFVALSALIGALTLGGWLHVGPVALSGAQIVKFGALWATVFVLVGCYEEGLFRCYLQFTLTRGINFWWALGIVGILCVRLATHSKGNGLWGVYAVALLGLFRRRRGSLRQSLAISTPATAARAVSESLPRPSSVLSSASAFASPAQPGGQLAATRRGTGRRRFFTAPPTAAWSPRATI
jgi:membrane protease YdiL (CAAX protease family)